MMILMPEQGSPDYYLPPMTNFQSLSGLGQIAGDYDVLLCDIWGVVHNGQAENKAATEALELFRGENGPVIHDR